VAVAGLILAAGAGRRLGQPKAELTVGGSRLIDIAATPLREGGCEPILAVVRSADVVADGVQTVVNQDPDRGMSSSLRLGLDSVQAAACLIVLVDQLGITGEDVRAVIEEFLAGWQVVVARRGGRRSHPVLVSRTLFAEFAGSAAGDQGARAFIDAHPERVRFLDLPDGVDDIDTPEDLRRLGGSSRGPR
jgi:CTP:molybdopterin cytidylyltransferase MocA